MKLVQLRQLSDGFYTWNGKEVTHCILAKYFSEKIRDEDLIPKLSILVLNEKITQEQKEKYYQSISRLDTAKGTITDVTNMMDFSYLLNMNFKIVREAQQSFTNVEADN